MSGATIAAFERGINATSDALAEQISGERAVIVQAERDYASQVSLAATGDALANPDFFSSRILRAQDRIAKLQGLQGTLRALGNGFGEALPGSADADLLR